MARRMMAVLSEPAKTLEIVKARICRSFIKACSFFAACLNLARKSRV